MRIAFLYPQDSVGLPWSMGQGVIDTLMRTGNEVLFVRMPTLTQASRRQFEEFKRLAPPIEKLMECDALIVSGPEHIAPWIEAAYERYEWKRLNIPTAAWLHECSEREDYTIDFDSIKWIARDWFFPAIQDAEKHDQEVFAKGNSHWLPFGVDTEMFKPVIFPVAYDVAFIGGLYDKRIAYLQALARHDHPPIRMGNVSVYGLSGYDNRQSTERYVRDICSMKIFFNLPAMSKMLTPKVFEVMACGTFLLSPQLPPETGANRNMALFDEKHLVYYRPSNLAYVAQLLRDWNGSDHDERRAEIRAQALAEIRTKHSLESRLAEMFEKMAIEISQAVN